VKGALPERPAIHTLHTAISSPPSVVARLSFDHVAVSTFSGSLACSSGSSPINVERVVPEWEESLVESGDHGESQEGKSYNWDHQRNCQKI